MIHGRSMCAVVGNQIGRKDRGPIARLEVDDLVEPGVAAGSAEADAGHHFFVAAHEVHDTRVRERREVLRQIARPVPLVRMCRILPLAVADPIARPGKRRHESARSVARGETAGVIEVQVRGEHDARRPLRVMPAARQRDVEALAAVETIDVAALRIHLVAAAGVDDHQPLAPHQQRPHRQPDSISLVGAARPAFPQRLRDGAKHRAAVEPEVSVEERRQLHIAESQGHRAVISASSTSTPCALAGWMNATSDPCAPGRGSSSISRMPFALSCASAARMSSTRSVTW